MGLTAIALFFLRQAAEAPRMTTGGWVFMIGAWAAIIPLAVFCFSKVLHNRKD